MRFFGSGAGSFFSVITSSWKIRSRRKHEKNDENPQDVLFLERKSANKFPEFSLPSNLRWLNIEACRWEWASKEALIIGVIYNRCCAGAWLVLREALIHIRLQGAEINWFQIHSRCSISWQSGKEDRVIWASRYQSRHRNPTLSPVAA
jgi:hypothetical protein